MGLYFGPKRFKLMALCSVLSIGIAELKEKIFEVAAMILHNTSSYSILKVQLNIEHLFEDVLSH